MNNNRMEHQPLSNASEAILVMTSMPDEASADALAQYLVEARLAACVNRLAPCESRYHWRGKIENAREIPLLIKTTSPCYAAVETAILKKHPYELPEIVYVHLAGGYPAYLQWIASTIKLDTRLE